MSDLLNLENYFTRIGYQGPRTATLDVLQALHRLHPAAIPFEDLNPLTGLAVKLDLASIERKLVDEQRGGYCFEQNTLFANVLMQLGFKVTPLLARVLWGASPDAKLPRTHMVLRIELDNETWLADVGFGGVTLTAPLRVAMDLAQPIPLGTFRLIDAGRDSAHLQVLAADGSWTPVYHVDLRAVEWVDYETSNWYTSTSPESLFAHNLLAARVLPEARLGLFNDQYNERDAAGKVIAERRLASAAELADCLRERFGLNLQGFDIAAIFERVRTRDDAN
ncbi:N-hydroxyarylamine O-acetyltransferase [Burkholderia sp. SRS-W-2-2016]|uniref:arylamine N-acetyltransferase family protein n=1 Tax=Burkholderia sp. SRS-W-2-2016 TaxID=1926878 RepID=UPI00094AB3EA|nr:arylamine N-acetyltransferase [Burkholderia sp. SRS-W-2-2016]OLL28868.1 N-hydroxyarylamine O-acetyltransferase [Burkholderia sp. SRS-W-2-2016]